MPWLHRFPFWIIWQLTEYSVCTFIWAFPFSEGLLRRLKGLQVFFHHFQEFRESESPSLSKTLPSWYRSTDELCVFILQINFRMPCIFEDLRAWFWSLLLLVSNPTEAVRKSTCVLELHESYSLSMLTVGI